MAGAMLTPALVGMVLWVALGAFQFGYGISELNALHERFTCSDALGCLHLSESGFGGVTVMFTIGGTVSSLAYSIIARLAKLGRRQGLQVSALFFLLGGLVLGTSQTALSLGLARFLQGLGAGISVVLVPLYLKEISPPELSGEIGILNQVAVVCGIFVAQAGGTAVMLAKSNWHRVPLISAGIAAVQLTIGIFWAIESPVWLESESISLGIVASGPSASGLRRRLWGMSEYEAIEEDDSVDIPPAFSTQHVQPSFRDGLWIVALTQMAQQFSGVNAILYYSTSILSSVMPGRAGTVGLLITLVNALMTFPPIFLVAEDRLGRRRLLLFSTLSMGTLCLVLAYSMMHDNAALSAAALVTVIACFSVGLGPIPFVILPEVLPSQRVSTGSSIGLGINWISNIIVGATFPPLRTALGAYDGHTGGLVFVLFALFNFLAGYFIARDYHYEGIQP